MSEQFSASREDSVPLTALTIAASSFHALASLGSRATAFASVIAFDLNQPPEHCLKLPHTYRHPKQNSALNLGYRNSGSSTKIKAVRPKQ